MVGLFTLSDCKRESEDFLNVVNHQLSFFVCDIVKFVKFSEIFVFFNKYNNGVCTNVNMEKDTHAIV